MDLLVTGAIDKLVPMLVNLLKDEYKLQKGVKVQVRSLSRELESAHAVLWLLAKAPPERLDPQLVLWARDIREASYDMVDILNTFRARIEGGATTQMGKLFDLSKFKARRSIAGAISGIMMRLKEVAELRGRYTIDSILGNRVATSVADPAIIASLYKNVTRLVGSNMAMGELLRDDYNALNQPISYEHVRYWGPVEVEFEDMKPLGDWLISDENKKLGVLSMVGMAGVGKTTVAAALYQKYCTQFENRAMVILSQQSDPEIVLSSILSQVSALGNNDVEEQGKGSNGSMFSRIRLPCRNQKDDAAAGQDKHQEIKMELRRHLENTRYLLLIDDLRIQSLSTWQIIKRYFPDNDRGSRIIITTRFHSVAMTCSSHDDTDIVHRVNCLPGFEAKMLFQKTFSECSSTQDIQPSLREIPDRVWEMCGGLPLAIVIMASLAAFKQQMTPKDWIQVCDSLFPTSRGFSIDNLTSLINHCYNDLDDDLKTCFLYLSVFPENHIVSRKQLIRRWIAEGFISEKQGLSVEEVAEMCFIQLINRNMIRPIQYSNRGSVKSCKVHGMIHQYISSIAANEDLITVVGGHWSLPRRRSSNKVRRLSLHSMDPTSAENVNSMNLSHVRSLTVFGSLKNLHLRSLKTSVVQILDLDGCTGFLENHVKVSHICEMVLLKYLSLRRTDIKDIPSNICNLRYLETLDIRETEVKKLPRAVEQMEQIRNLLCGNKRTRSGVKFPKEIKKGAMNNLCILSGIEITEGSTAASNFRHFTWLRKLAIYKVGTDTSVMEDLRSSIEHLGGHSLTTLVIDDESSDFLSSLDSMEAPPIYLRDLELSGRIHKLPAWIPRLFGLTNLTLSGTVLQTDTLILLSELNSLFSLTFSINEAKQSPDMTAILDKNKSDSGGEIFFPDRGFYNLKLLRIFVPLLPSLNFSSNATPSLERIELRFKSLEGFLGMDRLETLHDVVLTVYGERSQPTESILNHLKRELLKSKSKYQVIVHEHYDRME